MIHDLRTAVGVAEGGREDEAGREDAAEGGRETSSTSGQGTTGPSRPETVWRIRAGERLWRPAQFFREFSRDGRRSRPACR